MDRQASIISSQDDNIGENTPLLSGVQPRDTDKGAGHEHADPNKGFTLRRCMVFPLFVCFCLAGGVFMYEVPQYTQHRMMEQYRNHHVNMSVIVMNEYRESSRTDKCKINSSHHPDSNFDEVQKATAKWSMYYTQASYIPALLANLLWSSYSDILGRRFAFLLCCSGVTLRLCLFVLVIQFDLSLVYMVIGAAVDGMCGSFVLLYAALFSYISDVTYPGKQRTLSIVLVELLLGLSFTVASFSSGYIITGFGFLYPAIVCCCLDIIGILILVLFVPETKQRDNEPTRSRNVFRVLAESFKFYFSCVTQEKRVKYILLILGLMFVGIPAMNRSTMELLYQLGRPFCWDAKKIGYFGSIKSVIQTIVSMCGACLFRRCLADDSIATMSIFLNGASYIVEALAASNAVLYTVPVFASLSNLPLPMIRSLMSCLTPSDKQGVMYAGIGIIEGVCSLIGSVSNTEVYTATMSIMNGFVFVLMAIFTFIGASLLLVFMIVNRKYKTQTDNKNINGDVEHHDTN